MTEGSPAFYAVRGGGWRDWWTLLHPPYTVWHLSYVVLGASIAPQVHYARLGKALIAFFLAMGVGAHALDELNGRPLRTQIPSFALKAAAAASIAVAIALGIVNMHVVGWVGVPFIVFGAFIVMAYNLEWFAGRFHSDEWFALAWGAFPVLVGYWAVAGRFHPRVVPMILACYVLSLAQRTLSTPVRALRRRTAAVDGTLVRTDGSTEPITRATLMAAPERALRLLSLSVPLAATAVLALRW